MIRHLEKVESTQDEMKAWIREGGVRPLDAVIADRQLSGRGRQGARWVSPGREFSASVWITSQSLPLTWIPLWVGVITHGALVKKGFTTPRLRLKWPNDLVLTDSPGDAKLAGILCEKVEGGVIAGIGINVHSAPPIEGRETACLSALAEASLPDGFCRELLEQIIEDLAEQVDPSAFRRRFEAVSLFESGAPMAWADPATGKEGQGRYAGIGEHGEMLVDTESGRLRLFSEDVRRIQTRR